MTTRESLKLSYKILFCEIILFHEAILPGLSGSA